MNFLILSLVTTSLLLGHDYKVATASEEGSREETSYGLDVSFPVMRSVSTNYPWLDFYTDPEANPIPNKFKEMPLQVLGDRQKVYLEHLKGCRKKYPATDRDRPCDRFEYDRMLMNQRQPMSMKNFTETGFKKIRAPDSVFELVSKFWKENHFKGKEENWYGGNAMLNHWDSPTYLVSVDDQGLRDSGPRLKEHIWAAASATLEEWTSIELQPCSMYGIRVYSDGAVMLPHVDRLPLVVSAMINVAQDVDEDWPFEMYDHSGRAHNVTLQPGDMLLFESHSVIHGHPFPLRGRSYAMIFMHFEPTGRVLHHDDVGNYEVVDDNRDVDQKYQSAVKNSHGGQSAASDGRLPPYIKRESPEEENWRIQHPEGWKPPPATLPLESHIAAKKGSVKKLQKELEKSGNSASLLSARDEKGWQILHQGVTSGKKEIVELLVDHGADVNARTYGGYGETPLRIAEKEFGMRHPIVEYLKGLGALSLGPEL